MAKRTRWGLWEIFVLAALVSCSSDRVRESDLGEVRQALVVDATRVFGFESASDWSSSNGSQTSGVQHDEGSQALQVTSQGWVSVTSVKVAGPIAATATLAVDVVVPHLQSPLWYGQAQAFLNAPSLGIYNVPLGARPFPFPYTIFQRVQFSVPSNLIQKLAGSFADLQLTITLEGASGTYLLDNLRFISATDAAKPIARVKNSAILDFEDPNLWVAFQPTQVAASDIRIRGAHSVALSSLGWTRLQSALLSSGDAVAPFIAFDFRIPSPQVNQWWHGSIDLLASIPSKGLQDVAIGHQDLLTFPVGVLSRVLFPVPSNLLTALAGTYNDLSFAFVVNVPSNQTGNYLLDNMRFRVDGDNSDPERAEVSGSETPDITVTVPAKPIPSLGGSGDAAVQSAKQFVDWAAGARSDQVVQARQTIQGAANNADIVHALINAVDLNDVSPWERYLVIFSVLGEMKSPIGEDFFLHVVSLGLPTGVGTTRGSTAMVATMLQTKAVDGLAFMRTARSNAVILQLISQHPSATVRVEAIRAYLDNNGARGRSDVLAVVQPNEQIVLDWFDHLSEKDRTESFDDKLKAYLVKHPGIGSPPNAAN